MKPQLSIIIVHYQVLPELLDCLKSIKASKPKTSLEIIVVDNDEDQIISSKLKSEFPQVKYIKNPRNQGFGAANNLGAQKAQGQYLFFLNPDTLVAPGAIDALINSFKQEPRLGIVAPLLLDPQGKAYPLQGTRALTPASGMICLSFLNKLFPSNPVSKHFWLYDWDKKTSQAVAVVPGTAFMISQKLFSQINGFDPRFFLYFEETDLCRRVRQLGQKIIIEPRAKVTHLWGRSTQNLPTRKRRKIFSQSRFYYFHKHYGLLTAILVHLITSFPFLKWPKN